MSCTSPLYRIPDDTFNFKLLFDDDKKRVKNGGVFLKYPRLQFYRSYYRSGHFLGWNDDLVQVLPCGQCMSCRLNYSRNWAIRCSLEAAEHEHNYFVTLTYDDFSLPKGEFIDFAGDVYNSNLRRRDIQLFIKSLREWERKENHNTGIKVFYCGEYGGITSRPHYHLCVFGASQIPDLTYHHSVGGFKYYKSVKYERFWSHEGVLRGFVDIGECSFDSIAYTARYCLKKQKGKMRKDFLSFYESLDSDSRPDLRVQPFIGMSLKPGIGAAYYYRNKNQIRIEDLVKYQKKFTLYTSRPPRYYDKLFEREDPDGFAAVKLARSSNIPGAVRLRGKLFSESEPERFIREDQIARSREERFHVRGL